MDNLDCTVSPSEKKIAYHEINFREAERASFDRWLLADSAQGVGFPQIDPKFKIQSFDFAYSEKTSLNSVAPKSQLILVTGNLFFYAIV